MSVAAADCSEVEERGDHLYACVVCWWPRNWFRRTHELRCCRCDLRVLEP